MSLVAEQLTRDAMSSFANSTDPRTGELMALMVKHLHAFVVEAKVTKAEWLLGLEFLSAAAKITSDERNEFSLLSDTLGVSSMVDVVTTPSGSTASSVLGPFHNHDSFDIANGANLAGEQAGQRVWVHGQVLGVDGQPIAGAVLDFWQNADNGLYPAQDPAQDPQNLRGKITCDADGRYELLTIAPKPYTVPTDGPVGEMLAKANRNIWRPAHLHVIAAAPNHVGLVTELFPKTQDGGGAYINNDAVFGVRPSLIVDMKPCGNAAVAKRYGLSEPFLEIEFDFCLVKA